MDLRLIRYGTPFGFGWKKLMKKDFLKQQYYGGVQIFENMSSKELLIFIVDDQPTYSEILKSKLETSKRYTIYCFSTGEEALEYMYLEPDIVVVDYHLDGVNSNAAKGDVIRDRINQIAPNCEVIIISADHKLSFLSAVDESMKAIKYKDSFTAELISGKSEKLIEDQQAVERFTKKIKFAAVALALIFTINLLIL